MYKRLKIGVLALQGDFERHLSQLAALGIAGQEVRLSENLYGLDGLIIPGGESTAMNNLIDRFSMRQELVSFVKDKAVWGTCAGMIMLASDVNDPRIKPLKAINISVIRNGYGRQVFSFFADVSLDLDNNKVTVPASFIRAPIVNKFGPEVSVLARHETRPILLSHKNCLVSSFHTELHDDKTLLKYFLDTFVMPIQVSQSNLER
ncbi:MAG: pyridoxal 5'-phosphate synthase glutaminase subunit PdxT [candidate division Zixibacteria bacterium]|nr:pyridoxal 5'-phosphate synthase glutaminase subunit PdxT [candidate division Zixibacteria bacterium]